MIVYCSVPIRTGCGGTHNVAAKATSGGGCLNGSSAAHTPTGLPDLGGSNLPWGYELADFRGTLDVNRCTTGCLENGRNS